MLSSFLDSPKSPPSPLPPPTTSPISTLMASSPSHILCTSCLSLTPFSTFLIQCQFCLPTMQPREPPPLPSPSSILLAYLPPSAPGLPHSYISISNCSTATAAKKHWIQQGRKFVLLVLEDPNKGRGKWGCFQCCEDQRKQSERAKQQSSERPKNLVGWQDEMGDVEMGDCDPLNDVEMLGRSRNPTPFPDLTAPFQLAGTAPAVLFPRSWMRGDGGGEARVGSGMIPPELVPGQLPFRGLPGPFRLPQQKAWPSETKEEAMKREEPIVPLPFGQRPQFYNRPNFVRFLEKEEKWPLEKVQNKRLGLEKMGPGKLADLRKPAASPLLGGVKVLTKTETWPVEVGTKNQVEREREEFEVKKKKLEKAEPPMTPWERRVFEEERGLKGLGEKEWRGRNPAGLVEEERKTVRFDSFNWPERMRQRAEKAKQWLETGGKKDDEMGQEVQPQARPQGFGGWPTMGLNPPQPRKDDAGPKQEKDPGNLIRPPSQKAPPEQFTHGPFAVSTTPLAPPPQQPPVQPNTFTFNNTRPAPPTTTNPFTLAPTVFALPFPPIAPTQTKSPFKLFNPAAALPAVFSTAQARAFVPPPQQPPPIIPNTDPFKTSNPAAFTAFAPGPVSAPPAPAPVLQNFPPPVRTDLKIPGPLNPGTTDPPAFTTFAPASSFAHPNLPPPLSQPAREPNPFISTKPFAAPPVADNHPECSTLPPAPPQTFLPSEPLVKAPEEQPPWPPAKTRENATTVAADKPLGPTLPSRPNPTGNSKPINPTAATAKSSNPRPHVTSRPVNRRLFPDCDPTISSSSGPPAAASSLPEKHQLNKKQAKTTESNLRPEPKPAKRPTWRPSRSPRDTIELIAKPAVHERRVRLDESRPGRKRGKEDAGKEDIFGSGLTPKKKSVDDGKKRKNEKVMNTAKDNEIDEDTTNAKKRPSKLIAKTGALGSGGSGEERSKKEDAKKQKKTETGPKPLGDADEPVTEKGKKARGTGDAQDTDREFKPPPPPEAEIGRGYWPSIHEPVESKQHGVQGGLFWTGDVETEAILEDLFTPVKKKVDIPAVPKRNDGARGGRRLHMRSLRRMK